MTRYISYL